MSKGFELGGLKPKPQASATKNSFTEELSQGKPMVCPFSGIRISRSLISMEDLKTRMLSRKFIRTTQIRHHINKKTNDIEGDWVTIGVLVDKLPPRKTKNGKDFSIWKLNDLKNLDTNVVLMMFGQAHSNHWKLQKGQVIGLLNPRILPNKDNKSDLTLSIDNENRLLLFGSSADYGNCKGLKKNGDICNSVINLHDGQHCLYHIRLDYQKVASMRPELQSTLSGVQPKNSAMEKILHQGQFDLNKSKGKDRILSEFEKEKKAELIEKYKARKEVEANSLDKHLQFAAKSMAAQQLIQVRAKCAGDVQDKLTEDASQTKAKNLLAKIEKEEKTPQLGKGLKNGDFLDFTSSSSGKLSNSALAKIRAIQMMRARAQERAKPASTPEVKRKTNSSLERILQRVEANLNATDEELNLGGLNGIPGMPGSPAVSDVTRQKRKMVEEELQAKKRKQDAIAEIMSRKSSHEFEVKKAENEAVNRYFDVMEKRERLDERATGVTEIRCNVVQCKKCDYIAASQSNYCQNQRHDIIRKNVLKRFFRCKDCKLRTQTYDQILPIKRCSCGSDRFEKTGMQAERKAPKLENEKLQIRGEEIKFLNSLN